MNQTDKTAVARRALTTVALAALWLAGAGGGWAAEPPSGPTYTNSLGMGFVRFESGTFTMGVGTDLRILDIKDGPDWDEQPAHSVTLTAPFYVLTGRVTKAHFDQAGLGVAGEHGHVSWDRAAAFCAWLSQREGLTYRLPTEAEWDYVRRTPGTVADFAGEWVNDWHGPYRNVSLTNPAGPMAGVTKVARSDATNRLSQATSKEGQYVFRVVLDTASADRWVHSPLPFNQLAVKQSTAPALQGPDPAKPYFTVRFALPNPLWGNPPNGSLVGLDPAPGDYANLWTAPALEIMPNGDVLVVFYSGGMGNQEEPTIVRLVQARLRHGAEEFDMPELLMKFKGDVDGTPLQWREGSTNWLFTGTTVNGKGCVSPYVFRISRSTDSGATWTMTLPTFQDRVGSPQPINSAFRAPDGALYVATDEAGGAGNPQSLLRRSQDNGLTWQSQAGRTYGRHTTIVPLAPNGPLLGLGGKKSDINGYMPQTISTNWGATWETPTQSPFPKLAGNQRPCVIRLASGKLAMVGDAAVSDTRMTPPGWTNGPAPYVALSADNGTTWHFKALPVALHYGGNSSAHLTIGYSTVRQAPNGVIHVLGVFTPPGMHYEFNEAWVYSAEGDITPETGGGTVQSYSENYPGGALKATWSARSCPNGRYLLDGVETNYYANGIAQRVVTWASGRRTGEETLWAENGDKFWSWNHDLANSLSTWTHWWSNGQKRMESQWDTNPTAVDLPSRHFRGLVANGTARHWDSTGREVGSCIFSNGTLVSEYMAPMIASQPGDIAATECETATFSVTATGTAPLSYQWYKNQGPLAGATGTTYTTLATTTNDNGAAFMVTVTNVYSAVTSRVATLTVYPFGAPVAASGGTVTNYTLSGTNYRAHIFTGSGTLTGTAGGQVEILAVGGGGGGGGSDNSNGGGGGGGAGGLIYRVFTVGVQDYTVTVGAGGVGGAPNAGSGTAGSSSAFGTLVAQGGGNGIGYFAGGNGGSGAGGFGRGAAGGTGTQPGSASGGYGNNGGSSTSNPGGGGGGGGAGEAGFSGGSANGGNGGMGSTYDLSGTPTGYAGGGGGGCQSGSASVTATDGGGAGGAYGANGANATTNTGGGGGGGGVSGTGQTGGAGGSGIVIVRYVVGSGSSTSTYNVVYDGNGADSGNPPATQIKTQDVAVVVAGNTGNLVKASHTFSDWNTAANGTGTDYAPGASYTANANVTLYARWVSNAPPTITVGPAGTTVTAGQTAAFSVTATGTPILFYQWYTNDTPIGGATGTNYITAATALSDSGTQFKVIVTNAYGAATSSVATLTVNAAPTGGVSATGGTITNYTLNGTNYTAHIFASTAWNVTLTTNFNVTSAASSDCVEVLVVAGGGGGGISGGGPGGGGGGGAGEVVYKSSYSIAGPTNIPITVGCGGPGGVVSSAQLRGSNGWSSVFGNYKGHSIYQSYAFHQAQLVILKINWGSNDVSKRFVGAFRWPVRGKCGWKRRMIRFHILRAGLFSISGHTSGRCPAHGNGFC